MNILPKRNFRIAMIPSSTDGVNYYRLAAWAYEMRKHRNVIVDLLWFKYEIDPSRPHPWQEDFTSDEPHVRPDGTFSGLTVGKYIRECIDYTCELSDIVVWHPVHYENTFNFFLEMQHKHQKPFVLEADDNFIDVPSWNEAFHSFQAGQSYRRVAMDCIRNSDACVVSTPHLKESYSPFNEKIHVIENSLDFKGDRKFVGWDKVSVKKHKEIRLGWIGGRSHFNDLLMVSPSLREILVKHPDVRLYLVNSAFKKSCIATNTPYPFEGLKNVFEADRSVAINRYAKFFAHFGFDIGIAPLVDCNFNRSKSNLRWIENSALGIPCVATDISHFSQSIENGKTGFLIKDNDLNSWTKTLEMLINDQCLREQIGRNAYKKVKKDFNVKRNASKYLKILKEISGVSTVNTNLELEEVA